MFGSKRDKPDTKVHKRFRQLPNYEILNWADTVGSGIATSLYNYRKQGQEISLLEAKDAVAQLQAAIDVLYERHSE